MATGFVVPPLFSYLGACFLVFGGVWKLFDQAEVTAKEEERLRFGQWLKDIDLSSPWIIGESTAGASDGIEVNWASSFPLLFDHVFGKSHFSFKCFVRSSIASCVAWGVVALVSIAIYPEQIELYIKDGEPAFTAFSILGVVFLVNIVPDYFSLLETRRLIGLVARHRGIGTLIGLLIVDIIFTATIFFLSLFLFTLVLSHIVPFVGDPWVAFINTVQELRSSGLRLESLDAFPSVGIFFYAAFFTSVWLWLYYAVLIILAVLRIANGPWQWIVRTRDLEGQPYRTLGFALNLLLIIPMAVVGLAVL